MNEYKVIYKHGQFIDNKTKKRLIPVQGAEYIIIARSDAFTEEDAKLKVTERLSSNDKLKWVEQKYGKNKFGKILNAGEQLFFRIGNSKTIKGDENRQFIFLCILQEDLYLYLLKNRKGDNFDDWRLADCNCVLEKCLLGGLILNEKIPAESLNKLFCSTVMFYFSLQRSGSTNVFNTFVKYEEGMKIYLSEDFNKKYDNLGKIRKRFVENFNKAGL
jgi:hypothetical protein